MTDKDPINADVVEQSTNGADDSESLTDELNRETAVIAWSDLIRHFARGVVINVTAELDLVDTAAHMARDDAQSIQHWLEAGLMRRASDDDARDWTRREPEFWCVVTAPWVLVQEKPAEDDDSSAVTVH